MKIAIHFVEGQDRFSSLWIEYCKSRQISYKIVNCFESDIVTQIKDCSGLMFHFYLGADDKMVFAKQLLFSLETAGMKVFPNFKTMWHYDDKLGQKYLLESLNLPLVPSYAFYSKETALEWIRNTEFPKIFKLRNGAGSRNVKLLKDKGQALKLVEQAFGRGFSHNRNPWAQLKEKWRLYKLDKNKLGGFKSAIKKLLYVPKSERKYGVEKGYAYFQDFIPDNKFDIRVIVVDQKAIAIKRMVRPNDFRASGSGMLHYGREEFEMKTIKAAIDSAKTLGVQSVAFDFLHRDGTPLIGEISYCFPSKNFIEKCEGYWDHNLSWHPGPVNPYGWMVESLIKEINQSN